MAEAEAQGTSFWTTTFDDRVRRKLRFALDDSTRSVGYYLHLARERVLREEGVEYLAPSPPRLKPAEDFEAAILRGADDLIPTLIESLCEALATPFDSRLGYRGDPLAFARRVNAILLEHRVSFELINGVMVEKDSQELHATVVEPVLRLLSGRSGWQKVEDAYQAALRELSGRQPADAITDAATALQETLTLLGCEGNALGPLITSAKKKGLLGSHDVQLTNGVSSFLAWASADRSERGDAHKVGDTTQEDGWLAIHVIGALILRLVAPSDSSGVSA